MSFFIDSQVPWYLLPLSWGAKRETALILVSCCVPYWLELVMMHTVCVGMQPEKQHSWMKQEKSVPFWEKKMRSVNCIQFVSFPCKIRRNAGLKCCCIIFTPHNLYFSKHFLIKISQWEVFLMLLVSLWDVCVVKVLVVPFCHFICLFVLVTGADKFSLLVIPAISKHTETNNQCYLGNDT